MNEKSPARTRTVLLYIAAFAVAAFAAWAFDVPLLVHLRLIANEAYIDDGNSPSLTVDDVAVINAYPPRRLVGCLTIASKQMRRVILQALRSRRLPGDPNDWTDVLPILLNQFSKSTDRFERIALWQVIINVPRFSDADVESVFTFVENRLSDEDHWWTLCCQLLDTIVREHPDQKTRVLQVLERSLKITEPAESQITLSRLATLAPESLAAAAAARDCSRSLDLSWPSSHIEQIVQRQPHLADELLAGTGHQQAVVLKVADESNYFVRSPDQWSDRRAWITRDRLTRMKSIALALLNDADEGRFDAACSFLSQWSEFAEPLFEAARRTTGRRRSRAIISANYAADRRGLMEDERFLANHLPELLIWLDDDDADVRQSVLNSLHLSFPPNKDWLKRQRIGPDAPGVAACRKLLDKYPGKHDYACLTVLANATPHLDLRDVDRVAAALGRSIVEFRNGKSGAMASQGPFDANHRRLLDDIAKYPDRPAVRRTLDLHRSLIADSLIRP